MSISYPLIYCSVKNLLQYTPQLSLKKKVKVHSIFLFGRAAGEGAGDAKISSTLLYMSDVPGITGG